MVLVVVVGEVVANFECIKYLLNETLPPERERTIKEREREQRESKESKERAKREREKEREE